MADFPQMISFVAPRVAMIFQLWMSTQIAHNVLLGWLKFFVLLFRSRQSAVKWSLLIFERERIPSTFDRRCSLLANLSSSGRKLNKTQLKFLQTFFFFFCSCALDFPKSETAQRPVSMYVVFFKSLPSSLPTITCSSPSSLVKLNGRLIGREVPLPTEVTNKVIMVPSAWGEVDNAVRCS